VVVRTQRRTGEIIAGVAIAVFALLGRSWLQVTSTALLLLGVAGVLHGFLLPTRWGEVLEQTPTFSPPFQIWTLRKKSARRLLRFLRERIPMR
jgi:nitrate/nitrite transporter NarK